MMNGSQEGERRPIQRLTEDVVNRIAAGEVVQRPSAAIKELLENSLDAGASSIKVIVKDGGLKLLQISDNGHGIRKEDLSIVCERFTTSKITKFEDLASVTTYGFRGEALASITHVANLTITTKRRDDPCAWKAAYRDGKVIPLQPGQKAEAIPCAGNDGTTITVEDMFFNMPTRRMALKNHNEEYQRVLDVIGRYAVHNAGVSFSCKKHPSPAVDLATSTGSTISDVIRQVYGSTVANDLLSLTLQDESVHLSAEGFVSNPNYNARKFTFLLFINHRMVESLAIKRAIEAVYYTLLPKGSHPFAYLSLQLRPEEVDVNMHPTKQEIGLLNGDAIISALSTEVSRVLANVNESRTFATGGTLPKVISNIEHKRPSMELSGTQKAALSQQKMIRYDRKVQSILAFTADGDGAVPVKRQRTSDDLEKLESNQQEPLRKSSRSLKTMTPSKCRLDSILSLREEVDLQHHQGLTTILTGHTFVGIVDPVEGLSLIQNSTQLYLCNHRRLSNAFFYQLALSQFGDYSRVRLNPPPTLEDLIGIALDAKEQGDLPMPRSELKAKVLTQLLKVREMLEEYFSITITIEEETQLVALPLLHPEHLPNLDKMPSLLLRLALEVDWATEKDCFRGIFRELASLYTADVLDTDCEGGTKDSHDSGHNWRVEHRLFPSMRRNFKPPKDLVENDLIQIANLPDLYRIFERC